MGLLGFLKVVLAFLIYFVVPLFFLVGVYRIRLHPLREFPGPLLAKLSDCYGGFYAISKRTHLNIWNNHVKYDIYQNPNMTKSGLYIFSRLGGSPSIFSTLETKHQRQKRQFFSQALSDRSMSLFESTMLEDIDTFLQLILKSTRTSDPVDLSSHCQHLSFDIIGNLAVGQRLNLQLDDTNRILLRLLIIAKYRVNMIMHFPPLRIFNPVLKMIPSRQARDFARILANIFAARKAQSAESKRDVYSFLAKPASDGVFENIWSEIVFFITAGSTPPATTVCALFFYLSRKPECYRSLANEVRSTFSCADEIRSGPQLSNCKYLRACIDESLRISPPSLATLWREQSDGTGDFVTIDGHVVPKGTQVGVNIYALHHNEEYFPEPFSFKPDRWLEPRQGGNSEKSSLRSKIHDAFVPFIVGPRSCAGKAMVYQEVSLVVAKTFWYFDFERCSGPLGDVGGGKTSNQNGRNRVDEFQLFDVFNSHHQGPNLVFKSRGDFHNDLKPHTGVVVC
ncbi:cytochrome P450 [Xylaria sp. FL0064]|nr:cytochrome P450 [Xylaria sp. FL0064]